jgi:phosphopantothenate-cysteine ligase/phosphopantothenoylcysteine decarboxylase/phosphopantothenate--cysteine ligase
MNILVTAGNTLVPIDRVRAITNIFTGRTGAAIAVEAARRGHTVTLLTSHPETVAGIPIACQPYRTFEALEAAMAQHIGEGRLDAVVHSAAVSDYRVNGAFAPAAGTHFDSLNGLWHGAPPTCIQYTGGKIKSDERELWLRLVRLPKLVDMIRRDWEFRGILVKFKLEVGVTEAELLAIAERSRRHSDADWMVANTLERAAEWAYLGSASGYVRIERPDLAARLIDAIEKRFAEHTHG